MAISCSLVAFQKWYSVCGIFIGLSILLYFGFVENAWIIAALGGASGFYAGLLALDMFRSHVVKDDVLVMNIESPVSCGLKTAFCLFGIVAGLSLFIFFLVLGATRKEAVTADSSWVAAVWAFMTMKWAFGCAFHLYRYHQIAAYVALGETSSLKHEST